MVYAQLKRQIDKDGRASNGGMIDLSNIFDDISGTCYTDDMHLLQKCDEVVAESIASNVHSLIKAGLGVSDHSVSARLGAPSR